MAPAEKAEFGVAQHDAWRTIPRAHAMANGVYVAVVNRVGFETGNVLGKSAPGQGLEFWVDRSSVIPSAECLPKPRMIARRFSSAMWI